jgi:hypothetical protein
MRHPILGLYLEGDVICVCTCGDPLQSHNWLVRFESPKSLSDEEILELAGPYLLLGYRKDFLEQFFQEAL